MKPIHILSSDETAGVICQRLLQLQQACTAGLVPPSTAKYIVTPCADNADQITEDEILRCVRNLRDSGKKKLRTPLMVVQTTLWMPDTLPVVLLDVAAPKQAFQRARLPALPAPTPPRIAHIFPWELNVGGAQRLLHEWCAAEAACWKTLIITAGTGPARWSFGGATIRRVYGEQECDAVLQEFDPDITVHHAVHNALGTVVPKRGVTVWMVHTADILVDPVPDRQPPAAVFLNSPLENMHPTWHTVTLAGTGPTVVRLGVDLKRFCPKLHPLRNNLRCGIVGRLSPEKLTPGFAAELRAWKTDTWTIRIIGRGITNHYQNWLQEYFRDCPFVTFVGEVADENMPAALQDLDALLIPSSTESGSYALAEAMACGLPVIARDVGGIGFTCRQSSGVRLRNTDGELLAALHDLESASARAIAGGQNRAVACRFLDRTRQIEAYGQICRKLLEPEVSILLKTLDTPEETLRRWWRSLQYQTLREWQLLILDQGSTAVDTRNYLEYMARSDARVTLLWQADEESARPSQLSCVTLSCSPEECLKSGHLTEFVESVPMDRVSK